jgi:hypothetical protein
MFDMFLKRMNNVAIVSALKHWRVDHSTGMFFSLAKFPIFQKHPLLHLPVRSNSKLYKCPERGVEV